MMTDLHPELQSWLETATENLTEAGRGRVIDEALEGYLVLGWNRARAEGLGEEKSFAAAMQSLGNPRWAAKKFEETYLTKDDMKALKPIEYKFPWTKGKSGDGPQSDSVWKPTYAIYLSLLALLLGAIAIFSPTYSAEVGRLKMISTFVLFILGVGILFALINIVVIVPLASYQKKLLRTYVSCEALHKIAGIRIIEGLVIAPIGLIVYWMSYSFASGGGGEEDVTFFAIFVSLAFFILQHIVQRLWQVRNVYHKVRNGPLPI